jgi:hypothetical protein
MAGDVVAASHLIMQVLRAEGMGCADVFATNINVAKNIEADD